MFLLRPRGESLCQVVQSLYISVFLPQTINTLHVLLWTNAKLVSSLQDLPFLVPVDKVALFAYLNNYLPWLPQNDHLGT